MIVLPKVHFCFLNIWTNGGVGAPFNGFKPSSKIFLLTVPKAVLLLWIIYIISVVFLLCFRVRLFTDALWSPAGKGLTSWPSFGMSYCVVVTFPLVSWVMCGV